MGLIIKNFFPDLPFADFSKISQVLKEIARDDTITYQKKQELFDIAFSFLPKKKQNLGGKSTMVGIIAALNKHLGKDEIPQKYRIDDFIGAEDTYYSEEPMDSSDYIDDDHSDDGYYEETDEHSDEYEEDDSDESEEDHSDDDEDSEDQSEEDDHDDEESEDHSDDEDDSEDQ